MFISSWSLKRCGAIKNVKHNFRIKYRIAYFILGKKIIVDFKTCVLVCVVIRNEQIVVVPENHCRFSVSQTKYFNYIFDRSNDEDIFKRANYSWNLVREAQ